MAPYSWSVMRISPGDASRSDEATRFTAAVTLTVKTSRRGSPPRNVASASRACHSSGGSPRRRKSIGSSASRRRSSVTRSKTTRGSGPNEPVLRLVVVGSSIIRARASVQKVEGMSVGLGERDFGRGVTIAFRGAINRRAGGVSPLIRHPSRGAILNQGADAPRSPIRKVLSMSANPQVVVIGGGPAGSTASTLIAQKGRRVRIVRARALPALPHRRIAHPRDLLGARSG